MWRVGATETSEERLRRTQLLKGGDSDFSVVLKTEEEITEEPCL